MTPMASTQVDIAIVGGGMVGASLALALAATSRSVLVVEAHAPDAHDQPSFDERTTALGNGSRRVFETLGVWPALAKCAVAVREIRVSDAGRAGAARLTAEQQGLEALGYVVPNRAIGRALWQQLDAQPSIAIRIPARVRELRFAADAVRFMIDPVSADGAKAREAVEARVVVAADGAQSLVRAAAGIGAEIEDYDQVAVVVHVATDLPSSGIAYERFTKTGPLAVLPLSDGRYTVVWTLAPDRAREVCALDDASFKVALQADFGWRIGRIARIGARATYPLRLSRAERMTGTRAVLAGNAAQSLHPVAGQGFNLGLRDAALLAELLAAAPDPGASSVLESYERRRAADRRGMIGFTDGLVRLFGSERPGFALARNLGLTMFDLAPGAKRALSRLSWGFGREAPRLLRGLPVE
jgi:2-octaprenyl-6-methoxyphenol hydroxylase